MSAIQEKMESVRKYLKDCPLCGSNKDAFSIEYNPFVFTYKIKCHHCGVSMEDLSAQGNLGRLVNKWNNRIGDPIETWVCTDLES